MLLHPQFPGPNELDAGQTGQDILRHVKRSGRPRQQSTFFSHGYHL